MIVELSHTFTITIALFTVRNTSFCCRRLDEFFHKWLQMHPQEMDNPIALLDIFVITTGALEDFPLQLLYIRFISVATKHMQF
jgi:hypothetical protein